jgi:hypothetical protein
MIVLLVLIHIVLEQLDIQVQRLGFTIHLCGGNGSGGTCVLEGTDITLADGTTKKVEQLIIGDELKSKLVDSLTTDNVDTSDWNTELILSDDIVTVTNNEPSNVTM